jgi:di/tricarboxylate transporter
MTPDIMLVFGILGISVFLLVTEWIPMEVVALLVLGVTAITGLVEPADALLGFSNPAVVTVWAVFILSGGLTRTGVANVIGRVVLHISGSSETLMVIVIMTCAGVMSAIMNNVAVAALMMPVVMDIAKQTRTPNSRLLLPLAYGSLLGGLTTQIGTPPNILVSEALRENGLVAFRLFDFTPVGLAVMVAGILFMAFFGIRLLPLTMPSMPVSRQEDQDLSTQYQIQERMFSLQIPRNSALIGRSIADSRLGSVLGLNVVGITRVSQTKLAPTAGEILQENDALLVEGVLGEIESLKTELTRWSE